MHNNKLPVIRLMICAAVVAAVGLGIYIIVFLSEYSIINNVFQSLLAAVGMTAVGEIFAALSKFPIISYIISVVMCAAMYQIITPFSIFMIADFVDLNRVFSAYREMVMICLVLYSIALTVSILVGIFVLHRKDVFKPTQDQP
ncbi:MAG: hypothetical protein J1F03_03695 [Oscillospiraceae bacterium]|nr:hypothetical protein [Oscillospiraceae bacterium]